MTAILGIFNFDGAPGDERVARRMLARMRTRGAARTDVWSEGATVLAVARHDWESDRGFSGPVLVAREGNVAVAADASIYYRPDLLRRLTSRGMCPRGDTASQLILAAYRRWGERCVEYLEGDYAFVVWDGNARRAFCARDHSGVRPLFYAELDAQRTLVVSSAIDPILEHPSCSGEFNLREIAIDAAALSFSVTDETSYRGVRRLHGGWSLSRPAARVLQTYPHWEPPVAEPRSPSKLDHAAEELLALLSDAVAERLDAENPTSVWLSGGWDSTSVFAAGQRMLTSRDRGKRLAPVSMSLPADDPLCEDHLIRAVASRWNSSVMWIDSDPVPLLRSPEESARRRAEPWAHPYEQLTRALVRASRAGSTRVALTGMGGDFLFHVTLVYFADLLARGRFMTLWREWRAVRRKNSRGFLKWAVAPMLPPVLLRAAGRLRGDRVRGYFERAVPGWMDLRSACCDELRARAMVGTPRVTRPSRAAYEMYWLLTRPHFARVVASMGDFALEDGLEIRSPLADRRLITFAASRPRCERHSLGERKRLVRHAMRGLLPDQLLAPRPFKTGTLAGYFRRALPAVVPLLLRVSEAPLLAEFGVIDRRRFRRAVEFFSRTPGAEMGVQLLSTLQAELWLRGHLHPAATPISRTAGVEVGAIARAL